MFQNKETAVSSDQSKWSESYHAYFLSAQANVYRIKLRWKATREIKHNTLCYDIWIVYSTQLITLIITIFGVIIKVRFRKVK